MTRREGKQYDLETYDVNPPRTYVSTYRHSKITANVLAERFCIGPNRAYATLRATAQRGVRSAILPLARRYKADCMYNIKSLSGDFATDTLWAKHKSLNSNVATQLYSHKCGFHVPYHLQKATGETVGFTLSSFIHDYGDIQSFDHQLML